MTEKKAGATESRDAGSERANISFVVYDRSGASQEDECDEYEPLEGLGKFVRRVARAEESFIGKYLDGHEQSNARRTGGWFWDFEENVYNAFKAGSRKLKLHKVIGL